MGKFLSGRSYFFCRARARLVFAGVLTAAAGAALADVPTVVQRAGAVRIGEDSFARIAELAVREYRAHPLTTTLEPVEVHSIVGDIRATDLSVSLVPSALTLTPGDGKVDFAAAIDQLTLTIGAVTYSPPFLPLLRTTCRNFTILLGNGSPIHMGGKIEAELTRGKIETSLHDLSFELQRGQYDATGPVGCSGPILEDPITAEILRTVFPRLRVMAEMAIRKQLHDIVESVGSRIAALTEPRLALPLPANPLWRDRQVMVGVWPTSLALVHAGVDMSLGMSFVGTDAPSEADRAPRRFAETDLSGLLATLKVKPEVVDQILAKLFAGGSSPLPVSGREVPDAAGLLTRASMASFWPDIATRSEANDDLRVVLRFASAPRITRSPTRQFAVLAEGIELTVQINVGGLWIDYAVVTLNLGLDVDLDVESDTLGVLFSVKRLEVASRWAEGNQPRDNTFNHEAMHEVLSIILGSVGQGNLPRINFPPMSFGGYQIAPAGFGVDGQFARLEIRAERMP